MMRYLLCALVLLLPAQLTAQAPSASFTSHTDGQTVTSASIVITWKGCSMHSQNSYTTKIGATVLSTTQSNTFPCPEYNIGKNYSASGTLTTGDNVLSIQVCDVVFACTDFISITVHYAGPSVSVMPDGP